MKVKLNGRRSLFPRLDSMALTLHQSGHGHSHGGLSSHGHSHAPDEDGHANHAHGNHGDKDVEGVEQGTTHAISSLELVCFCFLFIFFTYIKWFH